MIKNKNQFKGFTFIEVIIVLAIIGIMAAIMIVSFGPAQSSMRLSGAQREVSSALNLAKNMALQGKTQLNGSNTETPCGYGFYVQDQETYYIFYNFLRNNFESCAQQNVNLSNNEDGRPNYRHFYSRSQYQEFRLQNGVKFNLSDVDKEVYYLVPSAKVYGQNGEVFGSDVLFGLTFNSINKNVSVDTLGIVTEN